MRPSHGTPCDDPTPDGPLAGALAAAKTPFEASAALLQLRGSMAELATPMGVGPVPGADPMRSKRVPDGAPAGRQFDYGCGRKRITGKSPSSHSR
jgi:hypothetical protein